MEESAFIKCSSCFSEIEVSRSSFYRLAGKAIRCPECSSPIPIPLQTTWEAFSQGGPAARNLDELRERTVADLDGDPIENEQDPGESPAGNSRASEGTGSPTGQPPVEGKTPSRVHFRKPDTGIHKGIYFALVIVLCVGGLWISIRMSSDKQPAAPAPAIPTATPPTVPPTPAPLPVVVVLPANEEEATEASNFAAYEQAFLQRGVEEANAKRKSLDATFSSSSERDAFWARHLPAGKKRVLRLMLLCSTCADDKGKCSRCKGQMFCSVCKGAKTCIFCKGHSIQKKLCRNCTCRLCGASGLCRACQGTGRVNCLSCGGTARTEMAVRESCSACGGSGFRAGLRNSQGAATRLACLVCRSRGWVTKTRSVACDICKEKGWVPCTSCGGNGKCAACGGKGHKIPCQVCGDSGIVEVYCPKCAGSGQCAECRGSGKCSLCRGTGVCPNCEGKGLTDLFRLPALSDWLTQDKGCVLIEPDGSLKREMEATAGHTAIEYNGRRLVVDAEPDEVVVIVQSNASEAGALIRKP